MGGGEEDAIRYPVSISSTTPTFTLYDTPTKWQTGTTSSIYWTYPTSHYYYQIRCPKCNTMNWAELDTVISCKGIKSSRSGKSTALCGARIRVVDDTVDYEVAVEK